MPLSALAAGADLVMQSSHKVLTAMGQAAMLHARGHRVNTARVSKALQVLQTSSPSYILLASLDAARRHAAAPDTWATPLAVAAAARAGLTALPGLSLLQRGSCGSEGSVAGWDPLRLVVNVAGLGLSGFAAAEWLEQQHSIVPELATAQLVVLVVGPGSQMADAEALTAAFTQLSELHPPQMAAVTDEQPEAAAAGTAAAATAEAAASSIHKSTAATDSSSCCSSDAQLLSNTPADQQQPNRQQQLGASPLSPRVAFFADTETVPLAAAAGRVCAELLCPYPPGVPLLFPGEVASKAAVQQLQATLADGGVVTGAQDATLQTVLVVVE